MKKYFYLVFLVIILGNQNSASANSNKGRLEERLDNLLQWEEKFGFKGSVLVVKDGEIILNRGYGSANDKSVISNTPQTLFFIASVSKPITALGVMKLVEQKKINLKDPITKYFVNVPDDKSSITVEMLLTHTSGLEQTYSCDNIADRNEAIETILQKTQVIAAPGEKYNYSGDNYSLLAAIIEIVSGKKFEYFISEKILQPAGIYHQSFAGKIPEINREEIASTIPNSSFPSLKSIPSTWGNKGRAGMILSVEDLYRLDNAFTENEILKSGTVAEILSPKIRNAAGSNYGLGFSLGTTIRNTKVFGHDGDDDNIGHNVVYLNFPEENLKIFVASNAGLYYGSSWSAVISSLLQRFLFKSAYSYDNDRLFYNEFLNYSTESVEKFEGVYNAGNTDYHVWINKNAQLTLSPVGEGGAETLGFSKTYSEKNDITKTILRETSQENYSMLNAFSKDDASFERNKTFMSKQWKSLTEKNGPVEKIEILGTANIWSGNYGSEIATWFKLYFSDNIIKLYRMEWDGNGKFTGLGGSRLPYPVMFTLNAIAKNEFIGFDPANGRTVAVNFLTDDKNNKDRKMMELNIENNKPLLLANSGKPELLPKRSAAELLYTIILTDGIPSAINTAAEIKNKSNRFYADENELNAVGYRLLKDDKTNEAIAIFSILVEAFPESANGFDSLGEAYMKAGNKPDAIKNYKRSLELDPENGNAKKMIEKLMQE